MFAHIDADLLVFRCGFAAERNRWYLGLDWQGDPDKQVGWQTIIEFDYKKELQDYLDEKLPNVETRQEGVDYAIWSERYLEPLSHALHNVNNCMEDILEKLNPTDYRCYLSGGKNFREEVAVTREYKGNRDPSHRPTYEEQIKKHIRENWPTMVTDGEEADDAIGYSHCAMYEEDPYSTVIVTQDKDLDMLPGLHYNFVKDERYDVSEAQADRNFWYQVCTGDSTDNIPGLPGVGIAKVRKRLEHIEDEHLPSEVISWYSGAAPAHAQDTWQDYLLEQMRLIWIRRKPGEMIELPDEGVDYESVEINLFD